MTAPSVTGSVMAAEMAEQPAVLRRLVAAREEIHEEVRRLVPRTPRGVALVGRGSSENALVFARYLLEIATQRPATFVAPSLHDLYGVDVDYRDHLALAASQSGRTPEIVGAVSRLATSGAATIAVTADTSSPLATAAHVAIDLRTGIERAVPATKTFTAQLAVAAMVAEALGPVPWHPADWDAVGDAVAEVVVDDQPARSVAIRLGQVSRLRTTARGVLFAVAREAALKLEETALVDVACHSAASFRHGPIAAVSSDSAVIAISAPGPAGDDVAGLVTTLRQRGVPVVTIGPAPGSDLPVPPGLPEPLAALPAAVRVQQLSLTVALQRGLDPDRPPGLEKVTVT